jgi:dTDP-4-dehydrorhamnose reductase
MKIAVTGHRGRLGSELVRLGCIPFAVDNDYEADISNSIVRDALSSTNPDVIINCAAITDVNSCETEEGYKKALSVNYYGVKNLRENFDGHLIQISTDYVFDGKHGPYPERAAWSKPPNMYGLTKQAAEMYLLSSPDNNHTVVRTTCLFGSTNKNDLAWNIINTLQDGEQFVSTFIEGNPTYIPFLAEALIKLATSPVKPTLVNIAGSDVLTRYEFALMLATEFRLPKENIIGTRKTILGSAKRPAHSGLKVDYAIKLGLPIYSAVEGVQAFKRNSDAKV